VMPSRYLDSNGKYVLITGAGAGFGEGLSIALDKAGWYVLAGVRRDASIKPLQAKLSSRATVFQLDVTNEDDIRRCQQLVKSKVGNGGLHCLVNNAGISGGNAPEDMLPLSEFRDVFEVNYFGQIAMTKAMKEFIIDAKKNDPRYGRYVNVTSVAGIVAAPTMAAYTSSKHAFEAYSDVIRRELRAWNIPVTIVEPGFFDTNMVVHSKGHTDRILDNVTDEIANRWGEAYLNTNKFDFVVMTSEHPRKAIKDLLHAVTSVSPRRRYLPGLQASLLFYPASLMPASVQDVLTPLMGGLSRPNPISPHQRVNWVYYASDFITRSAMYVMNNIFKYRVDRGDESERMTYQKLQEKRKDSFSHTSVSAANSNGKPKGR